MSLSSDTLHKWTDIYQTNACPFGFYTEDLRENHWMTVVLVLHTFLGKSWTFFVIQGSYSRERDLSQMLVGTLLQVACLCNFCMSHNKHRTKAYKHVLINKCSLNRIMFPSERHHFNPKYDRLAGWYHNYRRLGSWTILRKTIATRTRKTKCIIGNRLLDLDSQLDLHYCWHIKKVLWFCEVSGSLLAQVGIRLWPSWHDEKGCCPVGNVSRRDKKGWRPQCHVKDVSRRDEDDCHPPSHIEIISRHDEDGCHPPCLCQRDEEGCCPPATSKTCLDLTRRVATLLPMSKLYLDMIRRVAALLTTSKSSLDMTRRVVTLPSMSKSSLNVTRRVVTLPAMSKMSVDVTRWSPALPATSKTRGLPVVFPRNDE